MNQQQVSDLESNNLDDINNNSNNRFNYLI